MTGRLIVQPDAEADLVEAFRWYESKRAGLGADFLEAVSRTFNRVAERPLGYAVVHRQTRRVLLRRFPYAVLYTVRRMMFTCLGFCINGAIRALQKRARATSKMIDQEEQWTTTTC